MQLKIKQQLEEIIKVLPENKLEAVISFARCLRDKEESEELLKLQVTSKTYLDWLSSENDIYDKVFKDEIE